jgi:predicted ribosomally synthesized peptide with SipW-like signal peptide
MNIVNLISNKRIVLALGMIVVVAAIVISGTGAFFSDSETSANNVFTAGSIDLTVDHTMQTYNGVDCETCSVNVYSSAATTDVVAGTGSFAGPFPADAVEVSSPHPAWVAEATVAPAQWIWATDPTSVEDTTNGAEYTFQNTFNWNGGIAGVDLDLALAADNGYKVVMNGTTIVDNLGTESNYGATVNMAPYEGAILAEVQNGLNTLEITVWNKPLAADPVTGNPAGLIFNLNVERPEEECAADSDFQNMCELWVATDLDDGEYSFFNFNDVKPGDEGTNVISLHIETNDAFVCSFAHEIEDADNGITEPEGDDGDATDGAGNGELDDVLEFFIWGDDGDGVYESATEDTVVAAGSSIYDLDMGELDLEAGDTSFLGLAWCAGTQTVVGDVISCDGSSETNVSQTDSISAFLTLYAEQQRNNEGFSCEDVDLEGIHEPEEEIDWVETASAGGDAVEEDGILTLITADDVNSRVRYTNMNVDADLDLEDVSGFIYESEQVSATDTVNGNASFRLIVDLNGDASLVKDVTFEPYYNIAAHNALNDASIVPNTPQTWEATQTDGKFWASGVTTAAGVSGGGGAYATNFTLAQLSTAYPNAKVTGISIGMGTYNVNQVVEVDNLNFNGGMITGF